MFIKSTLALATALAIAGSSVAFAQHSDRKTSHRVFRSAPVQLNNYDAFEPKSFGAGHMPEAYYDQQQPGYPQSPPGGGY